MREPLSISSGSDEEIRNGNRITLSSAAFQKLKVLFMNGNAALSEGNNVHPTWGTLLPRRLETGLVITGMILKLEFTGAPIYYETSL